MLGETIFQGPCVNRRPVFQMIGNLKAIPDVSEYPGQGWITFDTIDGLVITGGGTIDGQGAQVWKYNDCKSNSDCVHLPAVSHQSIISFNLIFFHVFFYYALEQKIKSSNKS